MNVDIRADHHHYDQIFKHLIILWTFVQVDNERGSSFSNQLAFFSAAMQTESVVIRVANLLSL